MCTICAQFQPLAPDCAFVPLPNSAALLESDDAGDSVATSYRMEVGDTFSGDLASAGDRDWVAVTLTAGDSYAISLTGDTLSDPYLRLYDGGGRLLASNDDGGASLNSLLNYTVSTTGTYYVVAGSFADRTTGTYTLAISERDAPEPATLDELATFLTDGYWANNGGRRAFDTSQSNEITVNLTALTSDGQQLARWALEAWAMVANLRFTEVTSGGQITFDDSESGAFSTSSFSGGQIISSQVNVSTSWVSTYGTSMDSYSLQTYIHEIGHALGLGHQGSYNGNAQYGSDATFTNDSWQMSVMSYFSQTDNPTVNASEGFLPTTMMADIVAIQTLYGAPGGSGLTAGNTTWGANTTLTGSLGQLFTDLANGTTSATYSGRAVALTIYDQEGWDTLDLSTSTTDDRISLWHSTFSDVRGGIGNLGIARDTVIEQLITGAGSDLISGNWVANTITANGGNDTVWANNGDDLVFGNGGNDVLGGGDGHDQLWGGSGNDTAYGGAGNDRFGGEAGADALWGGGGDDSIYGGSGADTIGGDGGDDEIWGGSEGDVIYGGAGADTVGGGDGADQIWGGSGNDVLYAGADNDTLYGDEGSDTLWGGAGNDSLSGGGDNDLIYGGADSDTLSGQWGNDTLVGGTGGDTFIFAPGTGNDEVRDFSIGEGDRLRLDDALWSGTLTDAQVISTYATVHSWGTVFNFNGDYLTVLGANDASALAGAIDVF
ncbi:M10 family metallopeptidase C-terminal domain-containing protein [Thalassobius sp. Cn5-15]|uniref:M10 family metallopeptidase C-terminal domain-containing protein n=1 Tax=Thalassobius sp. Cn5-15 TaxID=2917763 RepID=UPI001EF25763|nr:M10 family metallopeptidase C-terminal domain-containing protein [Thalassobius sp. Cn5-15]MCG7494984.1 M10 family metallopeptidase C-terminal domain-containing protein [Thalassobius sp. Cn5-15]